MTGSLATQETTPTWNQGPLTPRDLVTSRPKAPWNLENQGPLPYCQRDRQVPSPTSGLDAMVLRTPVCRVPMLPMFIATSRTKPLDGRWNLETPTPWNHSLPGAEVSEKPNHRRQLGTVISSVALVPWLDGSLDTPDPQVSLHPFAACGSIPSSTRYQGARSAPSAMGPRDQAAASRSGAKVPSCPARLGFMAA
jgi:hypothetical protein